MHEVAAMRALVRTILDTASREGANQITHVGITLGAAGHITEEIARQHFAAMTRGTLAEGVPLDIIWLPADFQCLACLHCFEAIGEMPSGGNVLCPLCGQPALELAHHDVCYAHAIDVLVEEEPTDAIPMLSSTNGEC